MKIQVIHNEEAHEAALRELEAIMDKNPTRGSEKFEQVELLALVIKDYESHRFSVASPDPIAAIQFRMEQQGLTKRDLQKSLGSRVRVSQVLNRQRPLSLAMVRSLHLHLGIPADILIAEPKRAKRFSDRKKIGAQ